MEARSRATSAKSCRSASARARRASSAAVALVVGEAAGGGGCELRLLLDARAGARSRSRRRQLRASHGGDRRAPGTKIAADRRRAAREAPSRAVRTCTRLARSRGIAGRPISGRVRSSTASQPGSSRSTSRTPRATTRSFGRSSTTISLRFSDGREERRVDARRDESVVAGEALLRRVPCGLGEREQSIEPAEELLALGARGGIPETLRRGERRDGECVRVAQGEVGERRQPGLESVDDVEVALRECEREIRLHADRHAHLGAAGDGDRRSDCDHVRLALHAAARGGRRGGRPRESRARGSSPRGRGRAARPRPPRRAR